MEIIVTKDSLKIAEKDLVHKGEYNVNELTFTFSEEYEGLSKMAVFSNTLNAVQTAITNNTCIIPAEILLKKMDLTIGVYAYTLENNVLVKRLSPAPITIKVENGSYIKGLRNPQIDNPTLFEQFMEQLEGNIDDLQEQIDSKQDTLTPGDNITIENGVISANVPTKTSDLINDSGFIDKAVNDLENYSKTDEFKEVAFSGSYNDLLDLPTIPTKVSELQNDENYQTYDDVEAMISALGSVFTLKGTVNTIADLPQTDNQIGDVWYVKSESAGYVWINDDGTLRWEILGSTVDISDFLTKSGLAQTTGQNTDNAMSQKAITDALNTKQNTINNSNKLNPDYVATNTTKQFASETEKQTWNNKSDFSGDYNDLTNKPDLTIYEEKEDAETKYETLLSQIPTNEDLGNPVSGNPINVQDSSNLPIVDFALLGNATQADTPTPDTPQDIHVVTGDNTVKVLGANLLDPATFNSTTYVTNIDTNTSVVTIATNSNYGYTTIFDNMEIQAGTYTFYCEILEGTYTGGNLIFKRLDNTNYPNEFNFKASTTHIFRGNFSSGIKSLQIWNAYASTQVKLKIWFTKGNLTEMPTYQPYTEQTQLLSLGSIELAKIGTYTDRIFKSSGKWYVEKNIRKTILDGSDDEPYNMDEVASGTNYRSFNLSIANYVLPNSVCLCNKLSYSAESIYANDIQGIKPNSTGYYKFKILDSSLTSVSAFRSWIANNNLLIYGIYNTPPEPTEITDTTLLGQLEELLKKRTNKNVTNISIVPTGTNAEPTAEVEYRVDLGTVIGNISNAIISLGGNV